MRVVWMLLILPIIIAAPAFSQSWSAASTSGLTTVEWSCVGDNFTVVLKNPATSGKPYSLVAWSLQPFNIPAPVEVVCPNGWEWSGKGGWWKFELSKNSEKYQVNGPTVEPGESLQFLYMLGSCTEPVNRGGPGGDEPAFLVHVAAVGAQSDGRWASVTTEHGGSWCDAANVQPCPELPASITTILAFFTFGCLGLGRARV